MSLFTVVQMRKIPADVSVASPTATTAPDWQSLANRIQQLDSSADEELYRITSGAIRVMLVHRGIRSEHIEDLLHDVFIVVITAIRDGSIRNMDALPGFIRTVTLRKACTQITRYVEERMNPTSDILAICPAPAETSADRIALHADQELIAIRALRRLREFEREILVRFYVREQSGEQICAELGITETRYRLVKSRAKAKLAGMIDRQKVGSAREGLFRRIRSVAC